MHRKLKLNLLTNCKQLKRNSDSAKRRCRFRLSSALNKVWFKNKKSCAKRRSLKLKFVDRQKLKNTSNFLPTVTEKSSHLYC